jgi:hypothetical protein
MVSCYQYLCQKEQYHSPFESNIQFLLLYLFLQSLAILRLTMTAYGFTHSGRMSLPSDIVREKKEARKKLLETVFQRRREIYKRFMEKNRVINVTRSSPLAFLLFTTT